jgi:hypothetical protein
VVDSTNRTVQMTSIVDASMARIVIQSLNAMESERPKKIMTGMMMGEDDVDNKKDCNKEIRAKSMEVAYEVQGREGDDPLPKWVTALELPPL